MILGKILEKGGFDVHVVASGDAVLDALSGQEPVDAIVMDISMPGLSGLDAIKLLRFTEAGSPTKERVPVVAVTADEQRRTKRECLEAGADHFMVSPVKPAMLISTIKRLIAEREEARSSQSKVTGLLASAVENLHLGRDIIDFTIVGELHATGGKEYLKELAHSVKTDVEATLGFMRSAVEELDLAEFRQQAFNLASSTGNLGCRKIRAIHETTYHVSESQLQLLGPYIIKRVEIEIEAVCDVLLRYDRIAKATRANSTNE
jgi:two-component system sensor histidine kinase RpfC